MASPVFHHLIILLTTTTLLLLQETNSALVLPLTHFLSSNKFNTTHHLLKSVSTRSASRFHRHRRSISLPLSPGTDYTLSFTLGPHSQPISLYMDTGSDVVWLPCHPFDCLLCEGKYSPSLIPNPGPLNITTSKPATCKSPACSAAHSSLPSSDLCAIAKCPLEDIEIGDCKAYNCPPFYLAYGDGSFIGKLYEDTLTIPMSTPSLKIPKFTFGCAHSALGEPIGVAGFGRGILSLPAQLAATSPEIGNYFSYCLISHAFDQTGGVHARPSPLILGRYEKKTQLTDSDNTDTNTNTIETVNYKYTPLLENPKHSYFYCVGLEAIAVEKTIVHTPPSLKRVDVAGNGGLVVDSGTTFTMLPRGFFNSVMGEFDARVSKVYKRANRVESRTGLSPCYYGRRGEKSFGYVPRLVLHFGGNSTVAMPRRNYFYEFFDGEAKRNVGCVMLMDGGDEADNGGGPAGVLGNYQQQGFEVVYDLELKRVGFARRRCASLWDTLG